MGLFRRHKVWWMSFTYQGRQVRRSTETTDKRLAETILAKLRVKIAEGRFLDTLEEKDRTFNDMTDRYAHLSPAHLWKAIEGLAHVQGEGARASWSAPQSQSEFSQTQLLPVVKQGH